MPRDVLERLEVNRQRITLTAYVSEFTADRWFVDLLEPEHADQAFLTLLEHRDLRLDPLDRPLVHVRLGGSTLLGEHQLRCGEHLADLRPHPLFQESCRDVSPLTLPT